MAMRGIRGATTVEANTPAAIQAATSELLQELLAANQVRPEDLAAAFFSITPDLDAAFPAAAARALGWQQVPLLDLQEARTAHDLARCIRVLLLANTALPQAGVRHVYLRGAHGLRPDLEQQR